MSDEIYRHGDVLLVKIDKMPKDAKQSFSGDMYRLAEGEISGHYHEMSTIEKVESPSIEVWEFGGERFLCVKEQTQITHQEHSRIEVAAGTYRISMEREADPFTQQSFKVID